MWMPPAGGLESTTPQIPGKTVATPDKTAAGAKYRDHPQMAWATAAAPSNTRPQGRGSPKSRTVEKEISGRDLPAADNTSKRMKATKSSANLRALSWKGQDTAVHTP